MRPKSNLLCFSVPQRMLNMNFLGRILFCLKATYCMWKLVVYCVTKLHNVFWKLPRTCQKRNQASSKWPFRTLVPKNQVHEKKLGPFSRSSDLLPNFFFCSLVSISSAFRTKKASHGKLAGTILNSHTIFMFPFPSSYIRNFIFFEKNTRESWDIGDQSRAAH